MRMTLYYAVHSIINQIKKLLKSGLVIFILICIVIGGVVGVGIAIFTDSDEESEEHFEPEEIEELEETISEIDKQAVAVMIAGALTTFMFFGFASSGASGGSDIFVMADVNILFAAPLKPQSVLLFRLVSRLGSVLAGSIWLLFQIPNLVYNLDLGWREVASIIAAWILVLMFSNLISVLLYTIAATHTNVKKYVKGGIYICILLMAALFLLYKNAESLSLWEAAQGFFSTAPVKFVPVWGWIITLVGFAFSGNSAGAFIILGLLILSAIILAYIIWHIKADFYEQAMAKSEEVAAHTAALAEGRSARKKSKKDRPDTLKRDGLNKGRGANVFFHKAIYNRFRFAHLKIFTPSMDIYFIVTFVIIAIELNAGLPSPMAVIAATIGLIAFYRSLGNPLLHDLEMNCFHMIPESSAKKLFWSLISGTAYCFFDIILPFTLATIVLGENPGFSLLCILLILTVDFYSTCVNTFVHLMIPVSAGKMIKTMVQLLFIYFGAAPVAGLFILGLSLGGAALGLFFASLFCALSGGIAFSLSAFLLSNGRK